MDGGAEIPRREGTELAPREATPRDLFEKGEPTPERKARKVPVT